jgi:hypothetical protein
VLTLKQQVFWIWPVRRAKQRARRHTLPILDTTDSGLNLGEVIPVCTLPYRGREDCSRSLDVKKLDNFLAFAVES